MDAGLASPRSAAPAGGLILPTARSREGILPRISSSKPSEEVEGGPVEQSESRCVSSKKCTDDAPSVQNASRQSSARSSGRNFKELCNVIKVSHKATQGFSTLRDMGGVNIQPGDLKRVCKLGEGAFAIVEEAVYDPSGKRSSGRASTNGLSTAHRVAVKRLKPEIVNQEGDLNSFMNEVAILRKLAHKRIVAYIGVGSTDTSSDEAKRRTMFLVQEFMDGGTLKHLLSKQMIEVSRQLFTFQDAFRWAQQIAEGLEYLHNARPIVIHRDLKLENILLKGADPHTAEAKIADFGLVAMVRPLDRGLFEVLQASDAAHVQQSFMRRTFKRFISQKRKAQTVQELWNESFRVSQIAAASCRTLPPQQLSGRTGSYMYMAPEMYLQQEYNEKVDVFSFGVIIFELLSRYQMVCAISLAGTQEEVESYAQKVSKGYRPPVPATWPEAVRGLIEQCWHQDPAQRPTMTWVKDQLVKLQEEGTPAEMQLALGQHGCVCAIM